MYRLNLFSILLKKGSVGTLIKGKKGTLKVLVLYTLVVICIATVLS